MLRGRMLHKSSEKHEKKPQFTPIIGDYCSLQGANQLDDLTVRIQF